MPVLLRALILFFLPFSITKKTNQWYILSHIDPIRFVILTTIYHIIIIVDRTIPPPPLPPAAPTTRGMTRSSLKALNCPPPTLIINDNLRHYLPSLATRYYTELCIILILITPKRCTPAGRTPSTVRPGSARMWHCSATDDSPARNSSCMDHNSITGFVVVDDDCGGCRWCCCCCVGTYKKEKR